MNRLWVEETTNKRVALEKQIYELLKVELQLVEKKKELYQQYRDLMDDATQHILITDCSKVGGTTPYIKKGRFINLKRT